MRKFLKNNILNLLQTLYEAHGEVNKFVDNKDYNNAKIVLLDLQKAAVQIGTAIENSEGKGFITIKYLAEYCERVYELSQSISEGTSGEKVCAILDETLVKAENSIKNDIKIKLEVVFLTYKAAMWDSLESIWQAAESDINCDTYVMPIPYYDRNPDHSLGKFHYEGNEYPDYVPVTDYRKYDYKLRRPDIVYIHNPYDDCNYVTSVHPDYYSAELRKYTDCLVYVPYYATSGGMSEGQYSAPAYYNADYIVIQSERYRKYFDIKLDDSKFLMYGSPKFDSIINKCKQAPEIPENWSEYIKNKKIYFFNTSISGLLQNVEIFFDKMRYVFSCFENRDDAVIIWRPHPLLEATLKSMRPQYFIEYQKIKQDYINNKTGIIDNTSDIENTIALCDCYIGDNGTSVISLFGVVGKPIFSLNNALNKLPEDEDDYNAVFNTCMGIGIMDHGSAYTPYFNTLFRLDLDTLKSEKICKLSKYYSNVYLHGIKIGNKIYMCPRNTQDIVVIENNEVADRIELKPFIYQAGIFAAAYSYKKYIVLIPQKYPAIVRYDTESGELIYIQENLNAFTGYVNGSKVTGGSCIRNELIFIGSPDNNIFLAFNVITCKTQVLTNCSIDKCGCKYIVDDGKDLWFIPYRGSTITRFDPMTGSYKDYRNMPVGFGINDCCAEYVCSSESLFARGASYNDIIYLPPARANMFISINKRTDEVSEWKPGFDVPDKHKSVYFISNYTTNVKFSCMHISAGNYLLYSFYDGIFYKINFKTNKYEKIKPEINKKALIEAEPGFDYNSVWQQYSCPETAFNTLPDFLNNNITGKNFDKEKQIEAYNEINAGSDGTCGEKVHRFVKERFGL